MKKIVLIISIMWPLMFIGQSVEREVFATSGEFSTTSAIQASWTIGEPITNIGGNSNLIFTEGFNQHDDVPTGINEAKFNGNMSVYPNPASQMVNLLVNSPEVINGTIEILDITGKVLYTETVSISAQNWRKTYNFEQFDDGYYFLVIKNNNGTVVKSLKVQKVN